MTRTFVLFMAADYFYFYQLDVRHFC